MELDVRKAQKMQWWKDAKFGMFIHWGLYALPAGVWKDKGVPYISEWIMRSCRIPVREYEKLAEIFQPCYFNAEEWVKLATHAGMKYIVFTAKHHDGFAMYHSRISRFNCVDTCGWKTDPIRELAEACRKYGLKLCLYYSQVQDWHEADAVGNDWDFDKNAKDFQKYIEIKVKPQLKELLTQYGPIGILWFDTPMQCCDVISRELADYVRSLQPDCIVNGRIGNDKGDYFCYGDNQIPAGTDIPYWEVLGTMNGSWGYKITDNCWKSSGLLVQLLADIIGKGGTYLLNVGPTADGIIPSASVIRLKEIGEWMKRNREAIVGVEKNPFSCEFEWGTVSVKPGRMFLLFFNWPGTEFALHGLENRVVRAYPLSNPASGITFEQCHDEDSDFHCLKLKLPVEAVDTNVSVIALDIEGTAKVVEGLIQQGNGNIALETVHAVIHNEIGKPLIKLSETGITTNWIDSRDYLSWQFKVIKPGKFDINVATLVERPREWMDEKEGRWIGGHEIEMDVAGMRIEAVVMKGEILEDARSFYYKFMVSPCGCMKIEKPGIYNLILRAKKLNCQINEEEFFNDELSFKLKSIYLKYS